MTDSGKSKKIETATLLADGTIEVEELAIWSNGTKSHGTGIVQPGSPRFEQICERHPDLKVGKPHEVIIPIPDLQFNENVGLKVQPKFDL